MELLGKRVRVISGPFKGHAFRVTTFEQGLYWSEIDDEVVGFRRKELRETFFGMVLSFFSRNRT